MKPKFLVLFLISICSIAICNGQTYAPNLTLPNQIPPSPDAAVLGKYGEIPVNMTAGVPNISVPFYEIKTAKLSVPISINYDASGIKVDQTASWVGLQWDLSAGGVITRTINGVDDLTGGYYSAPVPPLATNVMESDDNSWNTLEQESLNIHPLLDTQPDFFFYNFVGHAGQFVFGEDKNPIDIHHQEPLKIQYTSINGVPTFNILDGSGNTYIFAANQQPDETYYYGIGNPGKKNDTYAISAWYLSQIISCDKTDTISFTYANDAAYLAWVENFSIVYNNTNTALFGYTQPRVFSNSMIPSYNLSTPLRLQTISFKNGKVNFYSSGPRNDIQEKQLDSIVVSRYDFASKSYLRMKSMKLSYGYYNNGSTSRLRLDAVNITGTKDENGGHYAFTYDANPLPDVRDHGKDLFGYYNGRSSNQNLVPESSMTAQMQGDITGADRNTYDSFLEHGILKQINYPTGGYSQFTYEPNQYLTDASTQNITKSVTANAINTPHATISFTPTVNSIADIYINTSGFTPNPRGSIKVGLYQNGVLVPGSGAEIDPVNGGNAHHYITLTANIQYTLEADCTVTSPTTDYATITATYGQPDPTNPSTAGGGLRVTTIKNFDVNGSYLNGQVYKYGASECGYGYLPIASTFFNTYNESQVFYFGETDPNTGLGCSTATATFQVYNAASIYDCFNLSGQAVSYNEVASYQVDQNGNPLGKTIYNYTLYHTVVAPGGVNFTTPTITNTAYKGGQLLAKCDYSYVNNAYVPVKKVTYGYQAIPGPQGRALKVERTMNVTGCYPTGILSPIRHRWEDVPISSGSILPISQTTYDYNTDNTSNAVVTSRTMTYDGSAHLQPVTITDATSDNGYVVSNMYYPEEKTSIANLTTSESTALDNMVQLHNLTPLIQQAVARNTAPVSLLKNDYQTWATNQIYPDTVEAQKANLPIEKRLVFANYDGNGNILQDALASGVTNAYIWDYNGRYPVAEVTNAAQTDIAYTSFEADGKGGWVLNPTAIQLDATSPTGSNCYNLSTASINKNAINAATTYIVSYWIKNQTTALGLTNGSTAITNTVVQGPTINGWTYFQHKFTGVTNVQLVGSCLVDELRLYPANAEMKTYTYVPLVGMTSSTNSKGENTYYEYDGLQRLINIKDQYGNVTKHMNYHYQQ